MPVYVDPLFTMQSKDPQAFRVGERNGHRWCHFFADFEDMDRLHAVAKAIGMRRAWFQTDGNLGHYDLTPGKRAAAIARGAVPVDTETAVGLWERWRVSQQLRPFLSPPGAYTMVASVILEADGGGVWLAQRKPYRPDLLFPHVWNPPGGLCAAGEHPLDTVLRELREEADVELQPHQVDFRRVHTHQEGGYNIVAFHFHAHIRACIPKDCPAEAHKMGPWTRFTLDEARRLPLLPGIDADLARLARLRAPR